MDAIEVIRRESNRFAEVLAAADPGARVPTCPDWTAADLLWHLTEVHSFWAGVLAGDVRTGEAAEAVEAAAPQRPGSVAEMLPVRERATAELLDQLAILDDAEPRWTWWDADQTVGFTRRMQTCEATMHRVDAELAAGVPVTPIAADVAAAAVDHCADVMWGWMPEWGSYEPLAVVRFAATDTDRDWRVEIGHWTGTGPESGNDFDWPRAVRADGGEPDATMTGPVHDLALWAWTRGGEVSTDGTPDALAALERLHAHGIQ